MPRPPSRNSVLRNARQILNLTQIELAPLVGCSKVTIEKFENIDGPISDELLSRIAGELQLNFWQLRENWTPEEPMTIQGAPLSAEGYEKWRLERRLATNKDRIDTDLRIHQMLCTMLLDAAAKAGKYHVTFAA